MDLREAFAAALKSVRTTRKITQEDFDGVSHRTYISLLERGERSPTVDKLSELSSVLGVHPLTLLAITYSKIGKTKNPIALLEQVKAELIQLLEHEKQTSVR